MASIPQIPKIVLLTIATNDFSDDVTAARLEFVPGDEQTVTTLDGVVHKDITPGGWVFNMTCVQDWDSGRPGLAYYLNAHAGETAAVAYNAHGTGTAGDADSPPVAFSAVLVPISYGGEGGVFATTDVSLPVTGTPVWDHTP